MIEKTLLFVGGLLDVGGAGKMLKYVANTCADYFTVSVLSYVQSQRPSDLHPSIKFINVPSLDQMTIMQRFKVMANIRKIIKANKPEIVCAFTSEVSVMTRLATLGINTIFVSAERGDPYTFPTIWKILTKFTYRRSDACFFQLEKARNFYGNKVIKKSYVIPNPYINTNEVLPYVGTRKKTIVSAGRFVHEKGFSDLIDAYAQIIKKHPEYILIIYGEGPLLKDYKKQLDNYGIADKVSFPGYVANVAEKIREDGIFVLSSLLEGIPNVLIEALSVGIPVVATDCSPGGPAFLTENGQRGIVVPLNNPTAMADAIDYLIENEDIYNKFVQRGPEIRIILSQMKISKMWIDSFVKISKNGKEKSFATY